MSVASTSNEAGFTASVVVRASPGEVFRFFTEPAGFADWFVVEGFTTEDVELDPVPGGAISAVMRSDDGGTSIPFRLRYGRLDPPWLAQFVFDDPMDAVTIVVRPTGDGRTTVSYHKAYGPDDAASGAQGMLAALEAAI